MAGNSNKIKFEISSIFTEEGFKKLNNAIKSAGRETKNVKDMFNGLLSEASKVDGTMGQVAGSVGGVIQAFAQMGIAGGVMAAVKAGADLLANSLYELAEEYDKVWQNENARIEADNMKLLNEKTMAVKASLATLKDVVFADATAFDSMTQAAAKMASAVAQVSAGQGATAISQILIDKFNEMMKAENQAAAQMIEAKYNVALAQEKQRQVEEKQNELVNQAKQAQIDAITAVTLATDKVLASQEALTVAQEAEKTARIKFGQNSQEYLAAQKNSQEAMNMLAQAQKDATERERARDLATVGVEAALANQQAALNMAALETAKATEAQKAVNGKLQYQEEVLSYSAYTEQEKQAAIKAYTDAIANNMSADRARQLAEDTLMQLKEARDKQEEQITDLMFKTKLERDAVEKAYTEVLKSGKTGQEAYNAALEKLKTSAEGLAKEQDKTKDKLKDDAGGKVNVKTTTTVTIDKASMADAIVDGMNRTQGTHAINNIQADISQQARNQRNFENALNGSVGSLQTAVNGIVNDRGWANDYATAWANQFKNYRWTGTDFNTMADKLMSQHSYTKQQRKDTIRALKKIKSMCVLAGTGKQDNS